MVVPDMGIAGIFCMDYFDLSYGISDTFIDIGQ